MDFFFFISKCKSVLCTEQLYLCSAATSVENADTSFIEDAVHGLLNSRRVLRASYAYGFFLTGNKDKRLIFESMQASVKAIFNCVCKVIRDVHCSLIGSENSRHSINQSNAKLKQIVTCSPAFSRASAVCLFS